MNKISDFKYIFTKTKYCKTVYDVDIIFSYEIVNKKDKQEEKDLKEVIKIYKLNGEEKLILPLDIFSIKDMTY